MAVLGLVVVANTSKLGAFYVRMLITILGMGFAASLGILSGIVLFFAQKREMINFIVARIYYLTTGTLLGISFEVEGREILDQGMPAIVISNHQSSLDILMLGCVFPRSCAIVAKKSMRFYPIMGQFMTLAQTVFLDRSNSKTSIDAFRKAAKQVQKKRVGVWIFPEGTRAHFTENDLLPFKKGAFHLATQAKVPIIPVVVENYSHIYDSKSKAFTSGVIKVKVLPPIPTENLTDDKESTDALRDQARDAMLIALKEMSSHRRATDIDLVKKIE
ncbi:hypothetical protein BZG36_04929 [Bifiguratus adelaidae]|uniref:1-acyl-sn-glycerol-3-phosphate acyltransferase n=1 Tax=Bifiguratus adelaidae TaxID=1938954 RepID=A0A261XX03_9FUNG|nr:hypothetical protein BZG36_04929 [Bifiguratus adelaidae]